MKFECPGHEGKCEFCKKEGGAPRSVEGMPEVDRTTGKRLIDNCCKACRGNMQDAAREYHRTSIS